MRHADWSEIDLDADEWNIPAGKTKMRLLHLAPLCEQAVAIVRDLRVLTSNGRACNRTAFLAGRRKMMQGWADYLAALKTEANVVPIGRKAKA